MSTRRAHHEEHADRHKERDLRPSPEEEQGFAEDLSRDSHGRTASSMEGLVQEDAAPLGVPEEEPYLLDPEPHRQHSRKGQAESPRELTPNRPEKKRRGRR